jgi:molybdopterin-guanine dinucleotide biosynthesis protein A
MGTAKASLPFGGETLLQRVVRQIGEIVRQVIVVAAPGQDVGSLAPATRLVHDRRKGRGPLEGLAAGLAVLEPEIRAVFLVGCDAPFIAPALVERLFMELGRHDIVVAKDDGFHHSLAAVYRTSIRRHVEALLEADRLRPAFLFELCDTREIPVEQLRDVDPELLSFQNLNQPHDYLSALARAGFSVPETVLQRLGLSMPNSPP